MPTTRSISNAKKTPSSKVDAGKGESAEEPESRLSDVGGLSGDLQNHLSGLQRGIRDLEKTHKVLLRKNRQLQQEIDRLHNETDVSIQPSRVKSGGKSNSLLHLKVNELQLEVRRLKKARTLDRKKISQLQLKEAHRDAEELQDEQVHGVPDLEHKMKKLLRHFHGVVSSPSLGEDEECSICAEALELNKCSSLPCQHIFCDVCLSKMSGGETLSCPQCRRRCDIESGEQVEFTATQQWDQLLEIAQRFAAMEEQLGPDTSEEEEEEEEQNLRENFIDNSDAEASTTSREQDTASDAMQEDESIRDGKGNAEPGIVSYSQSGATEKRKRMKRLVAQREQKRVRRAFT